jgi:tRNA nucleotidyltransferase (CCA-adding enzyme)
VRILRLARFAARFADFTRGPRNPGADARAWSPHGEVDALVPERVWQELARGLMEARPSRMVEVLRDCGALARLLPEVDRLFGVPQPAARHHPEVDTGAHLLLVLDEAAALPACQLAGALRLPAPRPRQGHHPSGRAAPPLRPRRT